MREQRPEHLASGCLLVGLPAGDWTPRVGQRIEALDPAGVILFGRNLVSAERTREMLGRIAERLTRPPLLAIDQEGGRVSRLERWIGPTVAARSLAALDESAARGFGEATGRALRWLGLNLDFAPVVDLSAVDATNGIGDRSFGTDPRLVTRMARAFLGGLQGAGVAGCLKHFPGLGHTAIDSHDALPTVRRPLERLREEDLLPYRELGDLPASVMVGHGHYPAFDGETPLPATLSPAIVGGELRGRLGFGGLVVSDDMEMGAVAGRDGEGAAAVAAVRAGCDLLLYCSDLDRAETAARALAAAARADDELGDRLLRASERVGRFAERWHGVTSPPELAEWRGCVAAFEAFRA
ncbi:MAG TPA: glycoside hydrolase family 3 N-terminal domain-containing protein [Candidatus Polarisedimenticolaceae bacterium]|nr:glycoside hydrolase family 3 N-terminal domain-containing protein [Candidatus Polarisedimenticolaceae bacterium]